MFSVNRGGERSQKVLIAEDDPVPRLMLERALVDWGYEVVVARDGNEAWEIMRQPDAPKLGIVDWMMPGLDGVELCRKVRTVPQSTPAYLILLTSRDHKKDIVTGLQAGANDYVSKPFDRQELEARLAVGRNVVDLQMAVAQRVHELENALAQVKQLQGLLPICCYCKKIRDDQNYWQQVETYFLDHLEVRFSHGICPDCFHAAMGEKLEPAGRR